MHPQRKDVQRFVDDFLRVDGVLVLRLIDSNTGYIHMSDILHQLWLNFNAIQTENTSDDDHMKPVKFDQTKSAHEIEDIDASE